MRRLTAERIRELAEERGLGTTIEDGDFSDTFLWFDADLIAFARTIEHELSKLNNLE